MVSAVPPLGQPLDVMLILNVTWKRESNKDSLTQSRQTAEGALLDFGCGATKMCKHPKDVLGPNKH